MPLEDEFGDIILKARAGLALSADEVARKAGITCTQLTQLEALVRKPEGGEIGSFAEILHLNPERLADIAFDRYAPAPVPESLSNRVTQVTGYIGEYQVKGHLVTDPATGETAMVDTAYNPEGMIEVIEKNGWFLKYILLTHTHHDHIGGIGKVLESFPVPVVVSPEEKSQLGADFDPSRDLTPKEGETLSLGKMTFRIIRTPGHTPGGTGFLFEKESPPFAFFGDAIFAGSLGRAYSPNSYPELVRAIREKVLTLSPETVLFPGHGPATTAGEEQAHNPFFNAGASG
ncbi:MAG TPA: MBL fold metallo-hydrolase [Nitrospiria bacterium]|nr:MBL fold metallo-hydrolase [Nitrospiria bacterium]